ncbi:uncharacterized protein LOC106639616 [Copidosoma floridanum]|uniref:uncharacterized protein LOC106639616 n=1 Tax=Copidosoma floridanum TaxID=29053 RepID=UPI0006C96856|nr:uncharacterized protein LOC106639616 [Copidosoma floridanum]
MSTIRKILTVAFVLCTVLTATSASILYPVKLKTAHRACSKDCMDGPSYWCQNITTSGCCSATSYCIPHKWISMQVPEDNDNVCNICKNMVQQARDQLESNETQEDLKHVFEGTCALIHIKPIVEECDKLVDQFVPDLVETLASQMNPSVVCSVAGLCNSARIDKLLEEYKDQPVVKMTEGQISLANDEYRPDECSKCYIITHHMEDQLNQATKDQVLNRFLEICGELSSFSDSCSAIILKYFETIYNHIKSNFNANNICHLSGQCSDRFHVHEDENKPLAVEIRPLSSVGKVDISDDLPCKFCVQLVGHLRDLLVANTTETEFLQVLRGICKQTGRFADECKSIVNNYYPEIYEFLTKNLNGNAVCQMASLCPAPDKKLGPIWPLVPPKHAHYALEIMKSNEMQLPLDRISIPGFPVIDDTYCSTCEFIIHHVKKNVKNIRDKNEIRSVFVGMKSITKNVQKIKDQEKQFLDYYQEALIELISQGKDFSEVCSLVAVCPTNQQIEAWKQIPDEMKIKSSKGESSCPLCKLAVTKIYEYIQDNKTEEDIQAALDKLCLKLMPKNLKEECVDLVKVYSKELIQMLLKDMSAEEICETLKLCKPSKTIKRHEIHIGDKIDAVPKNDLEGKQKCLLCQRVLHFIQKAITDPKAENEVEHIVKNVCKKLPKSIENDCNNFVADYASALVAIIAQEIDPSQICPMIHVCPSAQLLESYKKMESQNIANNYGEKPNCPLCLLGITQLENVIKNNKTKETIEGALKNLCTHLSKSLVDQCENFVHEYSAYIIDAMIADFTPTEVCVYLKICESSQDVKPSITFFPLDKDGQIMTNEIPDYPTYQLIPADIHNLEEDTSIANLEEDTECVICRKVMAYVEKKLATHKSKEEIEHIFHEVCDYLPGISIKCNEFVNDYGEIVIDLLTQEVSPLEICKIVGLCKSDTATENLKESVAECALCHSIVTNIEKLMSDPKIKDLDEVLSKVCQNVPVAEQKKCSTMLKAYEQNIINIFIKDGPHKVCSKVHLCSSNDFSLVSIMSSKIRQESDSIKLST